MYHRLQTLESDKKLQKFKKGLIDALKCIKIRHGRLNRECLCHQDATELCQQKSQPKIKNSPKQRDSTDSKMFLIKQRNSFPCSNSAAKKSVNLCSIFDKEEIEKTHVVKNSKSTIQQEKFKYTAGFHKIANLHNKLDHQNQLDENQISTIKEDANNKQNYSREKQDRTTELKRRKLKVYLRIDKKIIGSRQERADFNKTMNLRHKRTREVERKDYWKGAILNSEPCQEKLLYRQYVQELSRWSSQDESQDSPYFHV